ncbi:hypothetical protein CLOSCI_03856 [[Clostridium] scindens ATCC 35704]|nr:hypothetical protein CLOSCI_03856 [[Clostridium] scindens ATCC 35704]
MRLVASTESSSSERHSESLQAIIERKYKSAQLFMMGSTLKAFWYMIC